MLNDQNKATQYSAATETLGLTQTPHKVPSGNQADVTIKHKVKPQLSQVRLRELFDYKAETGLLIWRPRPLSDFKSRQVFSAWKTRYSGKVAGCVQNGYRIIRFDNVSYRAHRLIWVFHHGEIPDGKEIDHINGSRSDNTLENLRLATHAENLRNAGANRNNTSGRKGVHFHKPTKKYRAQIRVGGRRIVLGDFTSIEAATNAYREAALKYHGDFVHQSVLTSPVAQSVQPDLFSEVANG